MTHIIAGHFMQQDQVQHVIDHLLNVGFSKSQISSFYLNPPGQHALYPIGGDQNNSPGAKDGPKGVWKGAFLGGLAGITLGLIAFEHESPLITILSTLLGAHLGGLIGSLSSMKEREDKEQGRDAIVLRRAGMMVAVSVPDVSKENSVIEVLKEEGADQIEEAEGTIVNSTWEDFDPLAEPVILAQASDLPKK